MRPVDDKGCYGHGSAAQENPSTSSCNFELQNGSLAGKARHHRSKALGSRSKPTPSKWDDAQKWLVGLSGNKDHRQSKPRNSSADDRRLLYSLSQRGRDSCSSVDGTLEEVILAMTSSHDEGETKKIHCSESLGRSDKPVEESAMVARSVFLRDMGTEMTPIASKEPSRTGTPLHATTPMTRSPISSRTSSPGVPRQHENCQAGMTSERRNGSAVIGQAAGNGRPAVSTDGGNVSEVNASVQSRSSDSIEARAMAWDDVERAKYMARYKREEMKIQAWENHEKRKLEMEMKMMEVKADRLKARGQEKLANKLAATRRMAEEKRANAEAELNERAARASEKADYIRRTGHLPSSFFSFKMPSLCGWGD